MTESVNKMFPLQHIPNPSQLRGSQKPNNIKLMRFILHTQETYYHVYNPEVISSKVCLYIQNKITSSTNLFIEDQCFTRLIS